VTTIALFVMSPDFRFHTSYFRAFPATDRPATSFLGFCQLCWDGTLLDLSPTSSQNGKIALLAAAII